MVGGTFHVLTTLKLSVGELLDRDTDSRDRPGELANEDGDVLPVIDDFDPLDAGPLFLRKLKFRG